jgi:outer membrane lipoprotein-sorting protein
MKFHALFTFLSALLLSYTCAATSSPAAHLEKRATQVSVTSYTFTNNVLAGSIKVRIPPSLNACILAEIDNTRSKTSPTPRS